MQYYGYIKIASKEKKIELLNYANKKGIEINFVNSLNDIEKNSNLFIDSLCSLGNTVYQILSIFFELHNKEIKIYTYKDKYSNSRLDFLSYEVLVELIDFEKRNIENRLLKTKKTLTKKSKTAGRKKGKKTKSVFDKHKKTIFEDLEKNISQVKILNKLKNMDSSIESVTPQALGRFIKKHTKHIDPYESMRSKFI